MSFNVRLRELRKSKKITQVEFARDMDAALSTVAMWESGMRTPTAAVMANIAEYYDVSLDYLLGRSERPDRDEAEEIIFFPVLAGVRAGFDCAIEEIDTGDIQPVPRSLIRGQEPDEYHIFLVKGDSMSPKFLDGDRVLVHRQDSVDSGNIAIVAYDDFEEGTIKKVSYEPGCNYVDLIPINPKYKPVRLQDYELTGVRVIGKVVYLFREI